MERVSESVISITKRKRIVGCLLGGALGDAIGAQYENSSSPTTSDQSSLQITDDTQLTLATCESIVTRGKPMPEDIANNFLRWFREGRLRGLGSSTLKALRELDVGGHWALVGAVGERAAGNGAAMRVAPLAFLLDPADELQRQIIRDVCRITHRNDEAYIGALAIMHAIRHVAKDGKLDGGMLTTIAAALPDSRVRDRLAILSPSMTLAEYAAEYGASGYIVDTIGCALLAATKNSAWQKTVDEIIACEGDSDSIAALYAQVVGAAHGPAILPDKLERLEDIAAIRATVDQFAAFVSANAHIIPRDA